MERAASWDLRVRRTLKAAPMIVLFLLLNARSGRASCSFNPSPDPTVDGSSDSLRAAIQGANASGEDCTITLSAGTYTLTIANTNGHESAGAEGDLNITGAGHTTTIIGAGASQTIVNANSIDRAFQVLGGANAVFEKVTIENGLAQDDGTDGAQPGTTEAEGGGILVQDGGRLKLRRVIVQGNQALGGNGANAEGSGRPSMSVPAGTGQAAAGGGLFLSSGFIDAISSRLLHNVSTGGRGGHGLDFPGGGFHEGGNGASSAGGGLFVLAGNVELTSDTISGNSAVGGFGGTGGVTFSGVSQGGPGGLATGGGLYVASGGIEVITSTISENRATGGTGGRQGTNAALYANNFGAIGGGAQGAGIFLQNGSLHLSQSGIVRNAATGGQGGAYLADGGSAMGAGLFSTGGVVVANSTFADNVAAGGQYGGQLEYACGSQNTPCSCKSGSFCGGSASGGGLYVTSGSLTLLGTTVALNHARTKSVEPTNPGASSGGGIANAGATSLLIDTTLIAENGQDSGNAGNGGEVYGPITSRYSLFSSSDGATITDNGHNLIDADPLLDPTGLQDNGGPTETVALESGSPAIGAGDPTVCAAASPKGLGSVDQRGYWRNANCDIGAYEFDASPPTSK